MASYISGCGEVWYRAWFGTKRPWVQVPPLGPKITGCHQTDCDFYFKKGLEGRAEQSNSPVDCCDRERPSDRSRASQVPPLGPLKLLVYQRSYRLFKEFFLFVDPKVTTR